MRLFNKRIGFAICVILFTSCSNTEEKSNETIEESIESEELYQGRIVYDYGWRTRVRVFVIDSCEYIGFDAGSDGGTSIIHKQNCTNH